MKTVKELLFYLDTLIEEMTYRLNIERKYMDSSVNNPRIHEKWIVIVNVRLSMIAGMNEVVTMLTSIKDSKDELTTILSFIDAVFLYQSKYYIHYFNESSTKIDIVKAYENDEMDIDTFHKISLVNELISRVETGVCMMDVFLSISDKLREKEVN